MDELDRKVRAHYHLSDSEEGQEEENPSADLKLKPDKKES